MKIQVDVSKDEKKEALLAGRDEKVLTVAMQMMQLGIALAQLFELDPIDMQSVIDKCKEVDESSLEIHHA